MSRNYLPYDTFADYIYGLRASPGSTTAPVERSEVIHARISGFDSYHNNNNSYANKNVNHYRRLRGAGISCFT